MKAQEAQEHRSFQHTHLSVYILYPTAVACIFFDSTQVRHQRLIMLAVVTQQGLRCLVHLLAG